MKQVNRDYKNLLQEGHKAQVEKLRENDHKSGFDTEGMDVLFHKLTIEMRELYDEIFCDTPDYNKIRREAADVMNFAAMIILNCVQKLYRNK